MGLVAVVARLVGAVGLLLGGAALAFLDRDRVVATLRHPLDRAREIAPHLGLLVVVLAVNPLVRRLGRELSWIVGWNVTSQIYALEGPLVAHVQSVATPWLTRYFAAVYLVGYVFLLAFPVVAYWVLENPRPLRETVVAYAANYGIGVVCYTLVIAYGPRNLLPDAVDSLLYTAYPQTQLLTSSVNTNTNVFPSLHAALSVTVLLLAYRTRDVYPGWYRLTVPLVASVLLSTMYLGIHWATDVVAGSLLAAASVWLAGRVVDGDGTGRR